MTAAHQPAPCKALRESGWVISYNPNTLFVEGKHPRGGQMSIVEIHRSLSLRSRDSLDQIGEQIARLLNDGDEKPMTDFLTSSGRDAILRDMYAAHNCTPLAASAAAGMGREKFKKEQKRREKERGRCNQALGWYCRAVESGSVMETEGDAVRAAWAFVPFLVKLLWPMVAEALIKWIWGRVR